MLKKLISAVIVILAMSLPFLLHSIAHAVSSNTFGWTCVRRVLHAQHSERTFWTRRLHDSHGPMQVTDSLF